MPPGLCSCCARARFWTARGIGLADPVVDDLVGEALHELDVHVATP